MSTLLYAKAVNDSDSALNTAPIVNETKQLKYMVVDRVFTANDIGSAQGQTQHANGCPIAAIRNGKIIRILNSFYQPTLSLDDFVPFQVLQGVKIVNQRNIFVKNNSIAADSRVLLQILTTYSDDSLT